MLAINRRLKVPDVGPEAVGGQRQAPRQSSHRLTASPRASPALTLRAGLAHDADRPCRTERSRAVDLFADDGISDARRVADPHGVNLARWWTLCDRVLYARNRTLGTQGRGPAANTTPHLGQSEPVTRLRGRRVGPLLLDGAADPLDSA
jgi:hypothetical protein